MPIAILVLILNYFKPVDSMLIFNFLFACFGVIIGLTIFLVGVDLSISKIGMMMGNFIGNRDKIISVIIFGLFIGFTISIAEPDLFILANQISQTTSINPRLIVILVSLGVGIMISLGLYRIFKEIGISRFMIGVYTLIFMLIVITDDFGHSIAFDLSGATTGAMTTPFIIALGLGVSKLKGEIKGEKDSFGLVGIASSGPILVGLIISMFLKETNFDISLSEKISPLYFALQSTLFALVPIITVFVLMNIFVFKEKERIKKIFLGFIYTFIGLFLFIFSVEGGFMEVAYKIGENYSDSNFLPLLGFVLGLLVVLAEPAVQVLSSQVEDITGGHIKRKSILISLSIGVAMAVMLSMYKLKNDNFKLWMLVVPSLLISLSLSIKIPQIFVGIAFDSGAVASGPMTATFILAFCQGVAGNIKDGFGVIAFVCMIPIITIMILGTIYVRSNK
ncbi:MAG: DUF1538 domain-containing protein [Anaerococcus sp.]